VGCLDFNQTVAETRERSRRRDRGVPSTLALHPEPASSPSPSRMIRPTLFSVRISSASFVAAGVLKSVARGIIQVLTTAAVPVRCPLQIAIAGCRPTSGEAIYSLRGPSGCQVGIVLPSHPKPALEPGTPAIIHDLEAPYTGHDGTVLNVRNNRLSILSETNVALGGWVRVELADWVLFGVVREVMCAATTGRWLEIHLHAAFAADAPNPGGAL
jgi:hypothetical protein